MQASWARVAMEKEKKFLAIWISGVFIGLYAIGLGAYHLIKRDILLYEYDAAAIAVGLWFILCGTFVFAVVNSTSKCYRITSNVIAVITCILAFIFLWMQCSILALSAIDCRRDARCGAGPRPGNLFARSVMILLTLVESVLAVCQASHFCGCRCGANSMQGEQGQGEATLMSGQKPSPVRGIGYGALHNE